MCMAMVLFLFLCVLPVIMYIEDEFLRFILIALWCVLVAFISCMFMYLDRDGSGDKDSGEDE